MMGTDPPYCDHKWDGGAHLHVCEELALHQGPHVCMRCGGTRAQDATRLEQLINDLVAERFTPPDPI